MNLENELLEKFQIEELEKRFEMSIWTPGPTDVNPNTGEAGGVGWTIEWGG
ncbi:hypothetical protein [Flavobacterium undicola]|uniref:hypothetical protein n=1 Tax=Flavobacterium undicola TaxID=1932779 RepID=UPI0015E1CFE6|nr:hypothetical protein [Flavobacterium undicola]MBA0884769.1 hypothetical protein [Flavobacterium undicola]